MSDEGYGGADLASEKPSRTKRKKEATALQKTGEHLVTLSAVQLNAMDLPSELREAVVDARAMSSHSARRRQLQYIGSLMRGIDALPLQQRLEKIQNQTASDARQFKQVELWRDELKAGSIERMDWLMAQFPTLDRSKLARLVESARKDQSEAQARRAARELFRYLRQFAG